MVDMDALRARHWLKFDQSKIAGCHCGFTADPGEFDFGDSVAKHLMEVGAAAVKAECNPLAALKHETVFIPNFGGPRDVALHLTVRGEDAEVVLAIGTGWDGELPFRGEFVEFHSKAPMWDGHNASDATECPRGWDECFIDIRDSLGREGVETLRTKGSEAVWSWLDELWHGKFGGAS